MSETISLPPIFTLEDLANRWQAPGKTPGARRKWVWRKVHDWNVSHDGIRFPRFSLRAVLAAEDRHMGGRYS